MEAKQPVYSQSVIKRLKVQVPIPFEAGRRAGIKEVVEWIDKEDAIDRMMRERWQAKLKEWGIK